MKTEEMAIGSAWELVHVALGRVPADLLLTNARIVNVYSGEIHPADIAIKAGKIAAIREHFGNATMRVIDAQGAYVAPAFVEWTEGSSIPGGTAAICTSAEQVVAALRGGRIPVVGGTSATIEILRELKISGIDFVRICIRFASKSYSGKSSAGAQEVGSFLSAALEVGVGLAELFAMTSLNPAILCSQDHCLGSVAPGREASMFLFTDLDRPSPSLVIVEGQVVAGISIPVRSVSYTRPSGWSGVEDYRGL